MATDSSARWSGFCSLPYLEPQCSSCFSGADKVAGTIVWTAQGVFSHLLALGLYSLDLLPPIRVLHKPHYEIMLDGVARYYFAFHKLMGYVPA